MWPFSTPYPERTVEEIVDHVYDYIIVGAGTAGCALASRLSEGVDVTVLIIEKGPIQDTWQTRVPLISCALTSIPGMVYQDSMPNRGCNNRKIPMYRSESLGGNSRANGMIYTRGWPAIYNQWALQTGYTHWSWAAVEPYFLKIENRHNESSSKNDKNDILGPVQTLQYGPQFQFSNLVEKAASALGFPIEHHINRPEALPMGFFHFDLTIDSQGYRHSAFKSYLPKVLVAERQDHLTVCTGGVVTSIDLNAENGIATGVRVKGVKTGKMVQIRARREVILCCGTVGSPKLLQLSGIGPATLLEAHGIPLHCDLPVGKHLSDHQGIPICLELPFDQTFHIIQKSYLQAFWQLLRFQYNGTGLLKNGPTQSSIFLNTSHLDPLTHLPRKNIDSDPTNPGNIPDVEVMIVPASTLIDTEEVISLASIYTCLLQPRSEGCIEISSMDPEANPTIHLNFLDQAEDLQVVRNALRFSLNLTRYLSKELGFPQPAKLYLAPGTEQEPVKADLTDEELDNFARRNIQSVLHLACSCRMGSNGINSVVDGELRVHGFSNLRVADASVFPVIPAAHTMAPVYMIAERCADFVKEAWRDR
ncbi:Oxygen-dependent choline dehydrogenase [Daldinia childiae]|uniref:Oxygen-dependent choline dehydrogenase n=1 Tax=Daldinia childiae TaxID=326645 RepID=UPI001445501B|nr:Oxygen-dependent choline dehydrogenase [Daldinia childiae]KAF3066426.1 Oxygen-dependent choline dehydrogenase [Daldinia childiae]